MIEEKKPFLSAKNGAATGGLGALLTTLVPPLLPDADDPWRPALYALAPILSAIITYFMNWVINRHGLETPAEASLRNRSERDLKNIDKQLVSPHISPEFRVELLKDREKTVRQLVNIGKTVQVADASSPTNTVDTE
ncbi:hypothetical protein B7L51_001285 [Pectobacterium brasiliense]|uniref:hypothetical protein n=1 Tax=Pectobacterium brasiliense TaxID=180957 RepID=UPI000B973123|nr:hypothetical protein [Pectobacterium carotovorum]OYN53188.1 hypothetical protein B7L51_01310 [Pectobacterium carotovorum]